jgi:hypothetical protein
MRSQSWRHPGVRAPALWRIAGARDDHPRALPGPGPRHEAIGPREIARVLAPGGHLLTQQVDGADAEEIHEWFGTDPQYPEVSSERIVRDLEAERLLALDADRPIRVTQRRFRILASRDGV